MTVHNLPEAPSVNRRKFLTHCAAAAAGGVLTRGAQAVTAEHTAGSHTRSQIIDCETHVFPRHWDFRGCRVENLLQDMDRCGVGKTFLMFYSASMLASPCGELKDPNAKRFGESNEQTWEYFIESWKKHKDRFYFFNATDPREPDCIEKLEQQYKLGLQGLGETQPATQNILPNGPEFMRVYRFAADKGLPVVLTMERWEQSLCLKSKDFDDVFDMFEKVIREFKDVRFMLGHGGNCGSCKAKPFEQYRAANERCYRLMEKVDNLWICACMPWWIRENKVHPSFPKLLDYLRSRIGFSKVTWGSDWPYCGASRQFIFKSDYDTVVDLFRKETPCTEEERAQLLGRSAYEFVTGET